MMSRLEDHTLSAAPKMCAVALIALFAGLSLMLVAMGVKDYAAISDRTRENADVRDGLNYVVNQLRALDGLAKIEIRGEGEETALVFSQPDAEEPYETRVFCKNGQLWTQYARQDAPIDEQTSEPIAAAQAFWAEKGAVWIVHLRDAEGIIHTQYAAARGALE